MSLFATITLSAVLFFTPLVESDLIPIVTNRGKPSHECGTHLWTSIYGNAYSDHYASVGDVLVFKHTRGHNAVRMGNVNSYKKCRKHANNMDVSVAESDTCSDDECDTRYTVTDEDALAGNIYFACSFSPEGAWSHCKLGQKVKVIVTEEKPSVQPGCCNTFMSVPCEWFAKEAGRCDLVENSHTMCPTECRKQFLLQCKWFEEDLSRCNMVPNSAELCRDVCGAECLSSTS